MRHLFLLGTALVIASNVWAFGGVGLGLKSSSHKGGVSAIGVHINGKGKANIDIIDDDSASCPAERQCGDVCCGEGNMCNTATGQCCRQEYDGSMGECCAAGLPGYSTNDGGCCGEGTVPYISYYSVEESMNDTSCCAPDKVYRIYDYDYYEGDELWRYYEQGCCEDTIYPGVGYKGWNVCCDHEPTDYTNSKGETFKVCWTEDTECKTNSDCDYLGEGYYCSLNSKIKWSCHYPDSGTCKLVSEEGPVESANIIPGIGKKVTKSTEWISWWAADNWCKAQGKKLVRIEEMGCYNHENNTQMVSNSDFRSHCCQEGKDCDSWYKYWNNKEIKPGYEETVTSNYSETIVALRQAFDAAALWTASDFAPDNSCYVFDMYLFSGYTNNYERASYRSALCE